MQVASDLTGSKGLPGVIRAPCFSRSLCPLHYSLYWQAPCKWRQRRPPTAPDLRCLDSQLRGEVSLLQHKFWCDPLNPVACLRWPHHPWTRHLHRGIVYSGQTWVRDSPLVVSSPEIVCCTNEVWWFPRKMPGGGHQPREILHIKEWYSRWQQITNAK